MRAAAWWFPLDYRFRGGPSYFYAQQRFKGSGPAAIAEMRAALVINPNAFDIRRNLAGFLWEAGDIKGAMAQIERIHNAHPAAELGLTVNANPETL